MPHESTEGICNNTRQISVCFPYTTCSFRILFHSWCSPPLNTLKHLHRSLCPKHGSPHPYNSWKHQSSIRSKSSFVMPLCVTIDKVSHTISAFSSSVFFAHAILLSIMASTCLWTFLYGCKEAFSQFAVVSHNGFQSHVFTFFAFHAVFESNLHGVHPPYVLVKCSA